MWSLKFLSGPKAGKEIILQPGLVILGRDSSCQISIPSGSLSKKHAQILVKEKEVVIEDLNSRNGTFIDGQQIKKREMKAGDRGAFSDVFFELRKKASPGPLYPMYNMPPQGQPHFPDPSPANLASTPSAGINTKGPLGKNIQKVLGSYKDNVILPGVYKLAEWMEFKAVVGAFVLAFAVVVMIFSSFPLISILKSSVQQESRNNAENIALTLAQANRTHLKKGLQSAVTVDYALRRPGVEKAFIISAIDGRILAPAEVAHTYPKSPLIHKARKKDTKTVEKIGSSSIAAIVPISFYNPETGENSPRAYSVVIYDMGQLMVGSKKILSLLVQTFLIVFLFGACLFFFLIHLIEFPIKSINSQVDKALKDEKAPSISVNYQSQILTELCSHINSALNQISLSRMLNAKKEDDGNLEINRQNEMNNLVEIVGFPSLSINMEDETIASLNSNWSDQIGFAEILHQPVSEISDSNLKDHLEQLIQKGKDQPQEIIFGEVSLKQMNLQSACQFIMGKKAPAYAIVTFMSSETEEAA